MELERTYIFGEPTTRQLEVLAAVNEALELGKRLLKPGKVISDIHRETSAVLERHGFGQYIRHGTGHAHGIMIGAAGREEFGELRSYNHRTLQKGVINSIEPGLYISGLGGFRHSDVMYVTADGADCLTEFPISIQF